MIYQKLQQARIKLQGMELKKSGFNKFAGYPYFELRDFLPAIQTIFHDCGICGIVSFEEKIASLRLVDIDDGSEVTFTSPMGSAALKGVHEVQNIGAVETYQRRYLYVAAMEIVEHDALEATTGKEAPPKQASAAPTASKSVTVSEFEKLDFETQEWLRGIAMNATVLCHKEKYEEAVLYIKEQQLEDLKAPLWSLFETKHRTAMSSLEKNKAA